ncbi:MAG TPA: hemerythrin domain-containing protein [Burkholderiales bacterium]|nr:hemerythrin domain-containing protein [Burkholderiales bacterium]
MDTLLSKVSPNAVNMIRMDHTHVLATFHKYDKDTPTRIKLALVDNICLALEIHAQLEEEIFYPALRAVTTDNEVLDKAKPQHDEMRRVIGELRSMQPGDQAYDDKVMELMRDVMHHVADEETVLLPEAERLLANRLDEMGVEMTKRRLQLAGPRAGELAANTIKAMSTTTMVLAAGGLLAGSYVLRRAFARSH